MVYNNDFSKSYAARELAERERALVEPEKHNKPLFANVRKSTKVMTREQFNIYFNTAQNWLIKDYHCSNCNQTFSSRSNMLNACGCGSQYYTVKQVTRDEQYAHDEQMFVDEGYTIV